jgi:putative oxidoreductase
VIATVLPVLSRLCVAALFAWSGASKLSDPSLAASRIAARDLPVPTLLAVGAGLLEVLGAAALVLGFRARSASLLLVVYVIAATYLFHYVPAPSGLLQGLLPARMEMVHAMKNLAILGGLLGIAAHGPGPLSMEAGR